MRLLQTLASSPGTRGCASQRPEVHHLRCTSRIGMRLALMMGAAVVIWLGLFPGSVLDLARASAAGLGSAGGVVGVLP